MKFLYFRMNKRDKYVQILSLQYEPGLGRLALNSPWVYTRPFPTLIVKFFIC